MKIKHITAVLLAMTALTSCSMPNPDFGKVNDDAEVTTAAKETEVPETTKVSETKTTKSTAKTTTSTEKTTSSADTTTDTSATTAVTTDTPAPPTEFETEQWTKAHLKVLQDKPYKTVMGEEPYYVQLIDVNTDNKPELVFFSLSCTSFSAYACDNYGIDHLIAYGSNYDGNKYLYRPSGFAFGCRHPNSRSAHETFELRYFTAKEEHYHNLAFMHLGLCLDDMQTAYLEGHAMNGDTGSYADYGVTFDKPYEGRVLLTSEWTEFGPDNPLVQKLEDGEEAACINKLRDDYIKLKTNS